MSLVSDWSEILDNKEAFLGALLRVIVSDTSRFHEKFSCDVEKQLNTRESFYPPRVLVSSIVVANRALSSLAFSEKL